MARIQKAINGNYKCITDLKAGIGVTNVVKVSVAALTEDLKGLRETVKETSDKMQLAIEGWIVECV